MKTAPAPTDKVCKTCGESKPLSEYTRVAQRGGRFSTRGECKPCRARTERAARAADHLRIKAVAWSTAYYRKCRDCGKWKPSGEFQADARSTPLRAMPCKPCRNARLWHERRALGRGLPLLPVAVSDERWMRCIHCGDWKPATDFYKHRSGKPLRDTRCKSCNHAAKRAHDREKRAQNRIIAMEATGGSACVACGESDPIVMHFHHLDPATKADSVARLIRNTADVGRIVAEASKCVLLCANCHLRVHAGTIACPRG